jgi:hypothetical protein
MTTIYQKHDKAFPLVSAGILLKDGIVIGTLAFKFPKDGAGRLTCFLHIHGFCMVAGTASGYGYDKKGAAFESACRFLDEDCLKEWPVLGKVDCKGDSFEGFLKTVGITYAKAV